MNRKLAMFIAAVVLVAVVSVGAFLYLTRDVAAPTTDISESVQAVATTGDTADAKVYEIVSDETTAEYNIYELLNGEDKTVVGMTNQVAGQIALDMEDLSQSQIGELRINARTFTTDSDRRDNAVARFILQSESDDHEFIVFVPTSITGLSGTAQVGDTVEFTVTGDLTIAGVTQPTTFDVTASLTSEDMLSGDAETTISREAFNISIPDVPFVANVGDEVMLKLDFIASAV